MLKKIISKYMWKKKMKKLEKEIQSGRATINEARKKIGLSPIETGDTHITKVRFDNKRE